MQIGDILEHKGTAVITLYEGEALERAIALMDAHAIGALVITDRRGRLTGLISERDIVRELALHGAASLGRPIAQVTTPGLVSTSTDDSVQTALARMTQRHVRHLPVLEAGQICGLVSIGDLVKHQLSKHAPQDAVQAVCAAAS